MNQSQIQDVTPDEAWQILQRDPTAVLLDVRSKMEYDYVGHPKGALHIAWQEWPQWRINPHFVAEVRNALRQRIQPEAAPVLTLCRSGKRSLAAARALATAGFATVYNITEGFEGERDTEGHRNTSGGWRFRGLPWEQT